MEEDGQGGSLAREPLTSEKHTVNGDYSSCGQAAANCHQLESAECSHIRVDVSLKGEKKQKKGKAKRIEARPV